MAGTVVVTDPCFLDHVSPYPHPECPARLEAIHQRLTADGLLARCDRLSPRPATADELLATHSRAHVDRIAATRGQAPGTQDPDTYTGPRSYEAALRAAGGAIEGVEAVVSGRARNGLALVRPPGHHAERERAMGFCLFNTIAIAAHYALARHALERVLIVDWDVHHGNGTQQAFEDTDRVLFFSSHQYPWYPGTGRHDEVGSGRGAGFTMNAPLPAGCGDAEYLALFAEFVVPVGLAYRPQLILVSAGFDAHRADPLANMQVSTEGFAALARMLRDLAEETCGGKLVLVLEGGYDLHATPESVARVLEVLLGIDAAPRLAPPPAGARLRYGDLPGRMRGALGPCWSVLRG